MTIEYKYFKDNHYVPCTPKGTATIEEVINYIERLNKDIHITEPFYEIVDFGDVENFDFGYFESNTFMNHFKYLKESKGYLGSYLIASRSLSKGMSNIFSVIDESLGVTIKVFDSIDSAVKSGKDNIN